MFTLLKVILTLFVAMVLIINLSIIIIKIKLKDKKEPPQPKANEVFFSTDYQFEGYNFPKDLLKYAARKTLLRSHTHFMLQKSDYKYNPYKPRPPYLDDTIDFIANDDTKPFNKKNRKNDLSKISNWVIVMFKPSKNGILKKPNNIPLNQNLYKAANITQL